MSTSILPHKALNDINSMHHYLKQKLMSAKHVTDLIPFVNILIGTDELKKQLLSALDTQYQIENSNSKISSNENESKSKLRSLFVGLFSLNGIPSDMIHAHIISFLPSKEYKKIPILSKHFRNIMRQNAFIFNDKHYTIDIKFGTQNFSKDKPIKVSLKHNKKKISVSDDQDADDKKSDNNYSVDVQHGIIPFDKMKFWNIKAVDRYHRIMRNAQQNQKVGKHVSCMDDALNIFSTQLLVKNSNNIEKLNIELSNEAIVSNVFQQNNSFNKLKVLLLEHSEWKSTIKLDTNSFGNLQYLSLGMNDTTNIENINHILEHTANSLKALRLYPRIRSGVFMCGTGRRNWEYTKLKAAKTIKLPKNNCIEWICMKQLHLTLDMKECQTLIGVTLLCVDAQRILWPKKEDYMIPLVYLADNLGEQNWKNKVQKKKINAQFVILKHVKYDEPNNERQRMMYSRSEDRLVFNEDNDIQRISIDDVITASKSNKMNDDVNKNNNLLDKIMQFSVKSDKDKCMVLKKRDINNKLLNKVMRYCLKAERINNMKSVVCNEWKVSGSWIYDFADRKYYYY